MVEAKELKAAARYQVGRAVMRGELKPPQICDACGRDGPLQAHHFDYAKALDVRWLCRVCHGESHSLPIATKPGLDGLGARLRLARLEAGMPVADLAMLAGVDRTRPYRWQSGSERPALDTLVRVATALRVDLHWLLTGKRWKA